jgi:hypothetical protein
MEPPVGRSASASQPPTRPSNDSPWTGGDRHAYGNTHSDADFNTDFDAYTHGDGVRCGCRLGQYTG